MTKNPHFFSQQIVTMEMHSFPASIIIYHFTNEIFTFQQNKPMYQLVGKSVLSDKQIQQIQEIIFHDPQAKAFEALVGNYFVKFRVLSKLKEVLNSSFMSGQIINKVFENIEIIDKIYPETVVRIKQIGKETMEFACKTMMYIHQILRFNFYLQGIKINNPLGTSKILITKSIYLILKIVSDLFDNSIFRHITDSVWHVFLIWFFENPNNNIFHNTFLKLMYQTFNYGSIQNIIGILFKLNALGHMSIAYETFHNHNVFVY